MSLSRAAWNNICRKLQEQEDVIPDTDTRWCCIILCDGTWNAFWTAENCAGICSSAEWDLPDTMPSLDFFRFVAFG